MLRFSCHPRVVVHETYTNWSDLESIICSWVMIEKVHSNSPRFFGWNSCTLALLRDPG